jgi:para-aminobenzoate synthetase component 1
VIDPILPAAPWEARVEDWPGFIDPLDALAAARGRRHPVLLHSGPPDHPGARYSILACDPLLVLTLRGREATLGGPGAGAAREVRRTADPFDLLRALAPAGSVRRVPGVPFAGGVIGYLGYGLRRAVESLPGAPADPLGHPDAWLGLYDAAVIFDQRERRVALLAAGLGSGRPGDSADRAARRLAELRGLLAGAASRPETPAPPGCRARLVTPREAYLKVIERALAYIAAGDVYQVNLSHRIECPLAADPIDLFRALARTNPAPFAAYLDAGPFQVACASPERFLRLAGRRAVTSPIKGTRPRGGTAEEDRRLARELEESAKDRAENVMIADLARNDLGRVCEPGSVRVESLCALESFATVHHLVSTVGGTLRDDRDRIDLVRALFPGGSMTGAPKVRAMQVIDELEAEERGIYAGSLGYLSLDGGMDLNIVIRTVVCAAGRAHLRVGGAIVADSDPRREFRETLDKARALLRVLRAAL